MISSDAVCVDLEASVKLEKLLNQVFPDINFQALIFVAFVLIDRYVFFDGFL